MTWSCDQMEARLSDYLENSLTADDQRALEAHAQACARCAALLPEVSRLVNELHALEQLPAPPPLVYSILDKTIGPRQSSKGWRALFGWSRSVPSIQLAYGALSVIATVAIFLTASGFTWRHPSLATLQPINLYHHANSQAHLIYARGTKFVNNLRVVHEIQSRLRQDEIPTTPSPEPAAPQNPSPDSNSSQPASPRQQNRANDVLRHVVLAEALPLLNGDLASRRRLP